MTSNSDSSDSQRQQNFLPFEMRGEVTNDTMSLLSYRADQGSRLQNRPRTAASVATEDTELYAAVIDR